MGIVSLLFLLGMVPVDVRLERDAVFVDGVAVEGAALRLRDVGAVPVLVSSRAVEPLTGELRVTLEGGRVVVLEPGVRLERGGRLSTASGRPILVSYGSVKRILENNAALEAPEGTEVRASLVAPQDKDVDELLRRLEEKAKEAQKPKPKPRPKPVVRPRPKPVTPTGPREAYRFRSPLINASFATGSNLDLIRIELGSHYGVTP